MLRQAICSAILLSALVSAPGAALAENRLALVIGESAYRSVTALPNPANDAKAMSKLLADSGFDWLREIGAASAPRRRVAFAARNSS